MKTKKGRRPTTSAIQRGAALGYVKANPGALTKDIIAFLKWNHESGSKRLMRMCDIKELKREPVSVPCGVGNRVVRTYQYWALVDEIFGAEEVERILGLLDEGGEPVQEKEVLPPWHYKHNDPTRMAIQSQGGQGGSAPRCFSAISQLD